MSIESCLQNHAVLNSFAYYFVVFAATILYYTYAYLDEKNPNADNERSRWYEQNRRLVLGTQLIMTIVFVIAVVVFIIEQPIVFFKVPFHYLYILMVFPFTALMYYGVSFTSLQRYNLRDTGWLKPFFIGFVWTGVVTVYPVFFSDLACGKSYKFGLFNVLLFLKDFIFITILCIMFDIKDYTDDHNRQLKTFVVHLGLRKTINKILVPFCVAGLGMLFIYAFLCHFPLVKIVLNAIPFLLLIFVAYSMYQRKSILYYLAVIDGLMLVKAICGSLGILLSK